MAPSPSLVQRITVLWAGDGGVESRHAVRRRSGVKAKKAWPWRAGSLPAGLLPSPSWSNAQPVTFKTRPQSDPNPITPRQVCGLSAAALESGVTSPAILCLYAGRSVTVPRSSGQLNFIMAALCQQFNVPTMIHSTRIAQ